MSTTNIQHISESKSFKPSKTKVVKLGDEISNLRNSLHSNPLSNTIGFKIGNTLRIVKKTDIIRCESSGNYCYIHLSDGEKLLISKTLKIVEKTLCMKSFLRVHSSHLISVYDIKNLHQNEIEMQDGTVVPIARARRKDLLVDVKRLISVC